MLLAVRNFKDTDITVNAITINGKKTIHFFGFFTVLKTLSHDTRLNSLR